MNAFKHGMAAQRVFFEDDRERIQSKVNEWVPDLKADGPYQVFKVEQMAAAAVLIERCQDQENDFRYRQASRTEEGRALDLRIEAEKIGAGLARQPERVAPRLQQTVEGNEWLLARLRFLKEWICGPAENGAPRPLDEEHRSLALDVFGVARVFRGGRTVFDLPAGAASGTEADLAAHQARVIEERIAKLEQFKDEDLAEVGAIEGIASVMGRSIRMEPEIRLMRRYKKDAQRVLDRASAEFEQSRQTAKEERAAAEKARSSAQSDSTNMFAAAIAAEAAGRPRAESARPVPVVRVESAAAPAAAETTSAASAVAATTIDEGHEAFEEVLREVFPRDEDRRSWKARNQEKANRAAHRGFPG